MIQVNQWSIYMVQMVQWESELDYINHAGHQYHVTGQGRQLHFDKRCTKHRMCRADPYDDQLITILLTHFMLGPSVCKVGTI